LNDLDGGSSDFFSKRFPELAAEALCESSRDGWDVLVVDEAQDLLTPEHLDVFDLLLKNGLGRGCWHLFLDPHQNIYGDEIQSNVADRLNDYAPAYDDLYENCRNTRQIAVQTSIVSGIDLPIAGAPDGPDTEIQYYSTHEEAVELLENLIRRLIDSQVRPDNIAVLSTRRLENSFLSGRQRLAGFQLFEPKEDTAYRAGTIQFSTMHGFKGLERQAVIAIDLDEIGEDFWSMLHYTGLSRARVLLHLMPSASARTKYDQLAREFGSRLSVQSN
ncbi:MAG: nuclease, partial [Gammaproteobacteria bacterium]|nr:nuclease [Gammaproteobacteria bacterium]